MEPEVDRIIPDLVFNPLPVTQVRGPETLDAFELANTGENVVDGDDDMDEGDEAESEEGGAEMEEGGEGSQAAPAEGDDDILNVIPPKTKSEGTCPYLEYFSTRITRKFFRYTHYVPGDVRLELVTGDRLTFGEDFITVPLMAFVEGGLTFPLHKVFREFLHHFNLTTAQLSTNVFRVINSLAVLVERLGFEGFCAGDISRTYNMSYNSRHGRYFIQCRKSMVPLLIGIPDSERFTNYYVIVRGGFEFPEGEEGEFPIPRYRGSPGK